MSRRPAGTGAAVIASKGFQEAPPIDSRQAALKLASLVLDKKATDLVVMDVRNLVSYAEYVVVCSGSSERQVGAVAQAVQKQMAEAGVRCRGVEGVEGGRWVLMDFGDVVLHVFNEGARSLYDIEGLWPEAPLVAVPGYDRKRDQLGYAQFA